jgi:hypothetical protein
MVRVCSTHEEKITYKILVEKPGRKRPVGKLKRRREDNIKMDLREVGWGGMDLMMDTEIVFETSNNNSISIRLIS